MSKRLHVTLSDAFKRLEKWAKSEGTIANLAGFLLQKEIDAADREERIRPEDSPTPVTGNAK